MTTLNVSNCKDYHSENVSNDISEIAVGDTFGIACSDYVPEEGKKEQAMTDFQVTNVLPLNESCRVICQSGTCSRLRV